MDIFNSNAKESVHNKNVVDTEVVVHKTCFLRLHVRAIAAYSYIDTAIMRNCNDEKLKAVYYDWENEKQR